MLPIYYINVAHRTDRRDFMERQFKALGLAATRVDAVTPDRVPKTLLDRYCRPEDPWHSPIELSCNLTHQRVWSHLLEGNAPAAVVFEDDGVLSPHLPAFLSLLEGGVPEGIDLIKLETCNHGTRLSARHERRIGDFDLKRLVGSHYGACGYIITRGTVELALADRHLNDSIVDAYLFTRFGPTIYRRRVYQVTPGLSMQLAVAPERRGDPIGSSDLEVPRAALLERKGRRTSGWTRLLQNARSAMLDATYFAGDYRVLRGKRVPVPFAAD